LVNNAGGRKGTADFQETGVATFREGLEFNLMSPVELIALVLPHMREQRGGRIINISSIYGREYGGSIDYMTGKAALIAFSKHMALNLVKENVLVNCIAPGSIDFPGSSWDRFQQNSTPEEVADGVARIKVRALEHGNEIEDDHYGVLFSYFITIRSVGRDLKSIGILR